MTLSLDYARSIESELRNGVEYDYESGEPYVSSATRSMTRGADAINALITEVERLTPLQFRQAPCHKFCESTAYEIELRGARKEIADLTAELAQLRKPVTVRVPPEPDECGSCHQTVRDHARYCIFFNRQQQDNPND